MNIRLSSFSALGSVLSLAFACGGEAAHTGSTIVGAATAGQSAGFGGSGASDIAAGGVSHGSGAGAPSTGGASGSAGAVAQSRGGSAGASSGSTGGTAGTPSGTAGTPSGAAGMTGSTSAPIPPTWDTVKLVLSGTQPPCNGCHGNLGDAGFRITLNNDSQLFKSLTTTVVKDCGNNPIVTPGDPSKSALLVILQGDCSEKVPRMPPGCIDGDSGCVPPEYISALSQWISDGAPWP